jgi:predicted phosphodiesterase
MHIGILSDIHGNLPALEAVMADLQTQRVDSLYCLGDLVGYGASPNEVTQVIKDSGIQTIMGNYDDGVGFDRDECGCADRDPHERALGERSFAWTKDQTMPENKVFLRTLAPELRLDAAGQRVLLVHGSPRKNERVPIRRSSALEFPAAGRQIKRRPHCLRAHPSSVRQSRGQCVVRQCRLNRQAKRRRLASMLRHSVAGRGRASGNHPCPVRCRTRGSRDPGNRAPA